MFSISKQLGVKMPANISYTNHTFHVPVMGTGFTIDTPIKIAKYGISSVVSLVDDVLIEQMRKFHSEQLQENYQEISAKSEDFRACRITAYLDFLDRQIKNQVNTLQESLFSKDSEIVKYFEMLPDNSELKESYQDILKLPEGDKKQETQAKLRGQISAGRIDVNIMTKLNRDRYRNGEKLPPEQSDDMAALRGFAQSKIRASIVFSAGISKRLYRYMTEFDDFFPDANGETKKQIILKVSDYRSAEIQGRFLAKLGLWVSEFRIESGLNCGGHAFASKGHLLGVVLEEFKQKRSELSTKLSKIYKKAISSKTDLPNNCDRLNFSVTVQGGVGTADEHNFLIKHFKIDSVGWGTPFMLVPEATNMDETNIKRLSEAGSEDVYLSKNSPLGVLFWNMRTSSSEEARRMRVKEGKPGSTCPKGYAVTNTEFTERPICIAARAYQKMKLKHLPTETHLPEILSKVKENILAKACICHDLAGNATKKLGIDPKATSAVCCGPSIVDFSKIASLEEMVGHIYGRISLLTSSERPHMFIRELGLYVDYLHKEIDNLSTELSLHTVPYLQEMRQNLISGIDYYQTISNQLVEDCRDRFQQELSKIKQVLEPLTIGE